jgi:F0F1-type ATP synthase delta subunit
MPKLTSTQYAEALYDAVNQTADKDHDKVLDNFVKILATNGDLAKHTEIEAEYHRMERKRY